MFTVTKEVVWNVALQRVNAGGPKGLAGEASDTSGSGDVKVPAFALGVHSKTKVLPSGVGA
eukprot:8851705-Alexandrium_andersonii.AAC.1